MTMTNAEAINRFISEMRSGALKRDFRSGSLWARTTERGPALGYELPPNPSTGWRGWGPASLALYAPKRKTIVLNGDGFPHSGATLQQTRLRQRVQDHVRRVNLLQYVIVPFVALEAADIDPISIIPLHVTEDSYEYLWHKSPPHPPPPQAFTADSTASIVPPEGWSYNGAARAITMTTGGTNWSYQLVTSNVYQNPAGVIARRPSCYPYVDGDWTRIVQYAPDQTSLRITAATTFGTSGVWAVIEYRNAVPLRTGQGVSTVVVDADEPEREIPPDELGWVEEVHHLGASVFSAYCEGKRRYFISAFDNSERTPLYFLAQLPRRVGTYTEALDALAPDIVHKARLEGRRVLRQGDVFAIETHMTTEQVYADVRSRVRRAVVLGELDLAIENVLRNRRNAPVELSKMTPAPGEVRERVWCPCGCGHRRWSGASAKARRALSIYRTGHTATEVVVARNGTTYVRGTMHHDPHLEDPSRTTRDHQPIALGSGEEWYLCVRNTVPRRRVRRVTTREEESVAV